jgi:hypothetical protein
MSEFSESYHLRSERAEDAIELLRSAKRKGFVYEPANGWVTFVAEDANFEPDKRIVSAARQPLLHFVSAEDHGWSFSLFDGGKVVCEYSCEWEEDISADDSKYSRKALEQRVPSAHGPSLDDFERRMQPQSIDDLLEAAPSRVFAEAIGLERYEWLSYEYLSGDFGDDPDAHPDVTEVT